MTVRMPRISRNTAVDRGETMRTGYCFHQAAALAACLCVTLAGVLASNSALGSEAGGTIKALGVDTVLTGVMGPPGSLRLTTTAAYYEASETLDGNGDPRAGISNFKLRAEAASFRLQYVWRDAEVFGANIETRAGFVVYTHADLQFDVSTPVGKVHKQGSASGTGDMFVGPVLLGWHSETVHQTAGPLVFAPTGNFDPEKLASTGRGYWAIAPAYAVTWFPVDTVEADFTILYIYNYKNPDTNYRGGDEISADYALGYAITPAWQAGVNGYAYKQITDDQLNGRDVAGGNRGQVVAIGPYLRYHPSRDWGITFKWQAETLVENRPKGNRFMLQFGLKLW